MWLMVNSPHLERMLFIMLSKEQAHLLWNASQKTRFVQMKLMKKAIIEWTVSEKLPNSPFLIKYQDKVEIDQHRVGLLMPVFPRTVSDLRNAIKLDPVSSSEVSKMKN